MSTSKQRVARFLAVAVTAFAAPAAAQTARAGAPAEGTTWQQMPQGTPAAGATAPNQSAPPPATQPTPAPAPAGGYRPTPAYTPQPAYPQPAYPQPYGQAQGQQRNYAGYYQGYYQQPPALQPPADRPVAPPPEEEPQPPFFDIMVGTQLPLSLGADLSLELPYRILLQGGLGWMPPAYGSLIGGMMESFGAYDSTIATVIENTFENALVMRTSLGWRPFPDAGFEIVGGYTFVRASGSMSPADVAELAGGDLAAAVEEQELREDIELTSSLHNFHVGLGWRFLIVDHLVIRVMLGYTQTVGSTSSVDTPEIPAAGERATPIVDEQLDEVYRTYAKLPLFGVSAGYRF